MSTCSFGVYHNKPFSQVYSATDGRFAITGPVQDGSMLYYSNTYSKWVNTHVMSFDDTTGYLSAEGFAFNDDWLQYVSATNLVLAYNLSTVATIATNGVTTLVPTKIQTTADSSNASFFIPFVAVSTTQTLGQVLNTNSGLTFNPSTDTLTTDNFVGNFTGPLTGSASLVDTTLTGANQSYFLTFVNSAATVSNQVLRVDANLSYNPFTDALTTTTFIGKLTGSASLVDTTLTTTNSDLPLLFVSSPTTTTNQIARVNSGTTLNPSTNLLATTTIRLKDGANYFDTSVTSGYLNWVYNGTTSASLLSTGQLILQGSGSALSLKEQAGTKFWQLSPLFGGTLDFAYDGNTSATLTSSGTFTATLFSGSVTTVNTTATSTNSSFYVPFVSSATTTSNQVVRVDAGLSYNPSTNELTATTFIGSASKVQTTAIATNSSFFVPFVTLATTQTGGQTVFTDAGLSYNPSTDALTADEFIGSLTGPASEIATTANSTNASFYVPFVSLATTQASQTVFTDTGLSFNPSTNALTADQFVGNLTVTAGSTNTDFSVLFATSGSGSRILRSDSGVELTYNPSTNILTCPTVRINTAVEIYETVTPANYWNIDSTANKELAITSVGSDTLMTFDGTSRHVRSRPIELIPFYPPLLFPSPSVFQIDTPILSDNTTDLDVVYSSKANLDGTFYTTFADPSSSQVATMTMSFSGFNPVQRIVEVSVPVNHEANARTTVVGSTFSISQTTCTVSMTRNGSSFTNFATTYPTLPITKIYTLTTANTTFVYQQPFGQLEVYIYPTDSKGEDEYIISVTFGYSRTTTIGNITFTPKYGASGGAFSLNKGLTSLSTPVGGFTFVTASGVVSTYAITKTKDDVSTVMSTRYVSFDFINLTYSRTITAETSATEPMAFFGGFNRYEITWNFTTVGTLYSAFLFDVAYSNGQPLNTAGSYSGRIATLGTTYSPVTWSSSTPTIANFAQYTTTINMTITFPRDARPKVITATNFGSSSPSFVDCPQYSAGRLSAAVAFPSFYWSSTGAVTGSVLVRGFN